MLPIELVRMFVLGGGPDGALVLIGRSCGGGGTDEIGRRGGIPEGGRWEYGRSIGGPMLAPRIRSAIVFVPSLSALGKSMKSLLTTPESTGGAPFGAVGKVTFFSPFSLVKFLCNCLSSFFFASIFSMAVAVSLLSPWLARIFTVSSFEN